MPDSAAICSDYYYNPDPPFQNVISYSPTISKYELESGGEVIVSQWFERKEEQDQLLTIEYMSDPDNPEKKELLFEIKV